MSGWAAGAVGPRGRLWRSRWDRRQVLAGLASLGAASASGIGPAAAGDGSEIRFGLTPVFLNSDLDVLDGLKRYLESSLGRPVALVMRRTYQEVTSLLLSGYLDAAWICGYPYVQYRDRLSLVAVPVWRGRPLYQSYLIVDAARRALDVAGLRGDVHAFSDPDSNSGYLVTQAELARAGETPDTFFRKTFFTYAHRDVVRAVASGLAQSGSVDGYVWEVMSEVEPGLTSKTKVLRRSEWFGFPPIACAKSLADMRVVTGLSEALLAMAQDRAGREVLQMLNLDGFVGGDPGLFDGIAANFELVRRLG